MTPAIKVTMSFKFPDHLIKVIIINNGYRIYKEHEVSPQHGILIKYENGDLKNKLCIYFINLNIMEKDTTFRANGHSAEVPSANN